jgi:hypothetical protein
VPPLSRPAHSSPPQTETNAFAHQCDTAETARRADHRKPPVKAATPGKPALTARRADRCEPGVERSDTPGTRPPRAAPCKGARAPSMHPPPRRGTPAPQNPPTPARSTMEPIAPAIVPAPPLYPRPAPHPRTRPTRPPPAPVPAGSPAPGVQRTSVPPGHQKQSSGPFFARPLASRTAACSALSPAPDTGVLSRGAAGLIKIAEPILMARSQCHLPATSPRRRPIARCPNQIHR